MTGKKTKGDSGPKQARQLLELAWALSRNAWLNIDEIQEEIEGITKKPVSKRTAERWRDALVELFPGEMQVERISETGKKHWRLAKNKMFAFLSRIPRKKNMEYAKAIQKAEELFENHDLYREKKILEDLTRRLRYAMKEEDEVWVKSDVEDMLETEGRLYKPRPKTLANSGILPAIYEAILRQKKVEITVNVKTNRHFPRSTHAPIEITVEPYGIVSGNRDYLIAFSLKDNQYRAFQLGHITVVKMLDDRIEERGEFLINNYLDDPYGLNKTTQAKKHSIELRFRNILAEDARHFSFHPKQTIEEGNDGSVIVKFKTVGLEDLCWELFTWAPEVDVIAPKKLKDRYKELLRNAYHSQIMLSGNSMHFTADHAGRTFIEATGTLEDVFNEMQMKSVYDLNGMSRAEKSEYIKQFNVISEQYAENIAKAGEEFSREAMALSSTKKKHLSVSK